MLKYHGLMVNELEIFYLLILLNYCECLGTRVLATLGNTHLTMN